MTEIEFLKKQKELLDSGYNVVDESQYLLVFGKGTHFTQSMYDHNNKIHYYVKEKKKKIVPDPIIDDPNKNKDKDKKCQFPDTPFKNGEEGNEFRKWVRDNFYDYAVQIDLSSSGSFNNCNYIRKAYANVMSGYALSLGEIYTRMKKNPNLKISNFLIKNYEKFKEEEKFEQLYTSDKKMWEDLVNKNEITKYGEIKKINNSGGAAYVTRYVKDTNNLVKSQAPINVSSKEDILNELEKYDLIVLLPPKDRNRIPLKGEIAIYKIIEKDVNFEKSVKLVKEPGSYWEAFELGMSLSNNEHIIKDIKNLLKENIVRSKDDPNSDVALNINRNLNNNTNKDKNDLDNNICVITPQQKKDLDDFIVNNGDNYQAMDSSQDPVTKNYSLTAYTDSNKIKSLGQYTIVKLKDLNYTGGKTAISNPETISDNCVVYKRTNIVNKQPDQVKALEDFFTADTFNLTTSVPKIGGLALNFGIYSLIPLEYIKNSYKEDFKLDSPVKLYLKDFKKVDTTRQGCRTAINTLYSCIKNKGSLRECNNLSKIVDYKLDAYFCDKMVKNEKSYKDDKEQGGFFQGQGKFWSLLGLGNEIKTIKEDVSYQNSLYSIMNMVQGTGSLNENISKNLIKAINLKKQKNLSQIIKNNLYLYLD